jgi:hypothetical protein
MRHSPHFSLGPIGTFGIVAHAPNLPPAEHAACPSPPEASKTLGYSNLKTLFQEIEQVSRKMSMIS